MLMGNCVTDYYEFSLRRKGKKNLQCFQVINSSCGIFFLSPSNLLLCTKRAVLHFTGK